MDLADTPRVAAIIVAAGSSSRLAGDVPKVYRRTGGKMVLEQALEPFLQHPNISSVLVVANPQHAHLYKELHEQGMWFCAGGKTRQESVYAGLDALADNPPDWVLVHDAARPLVSREVIDRVLAALATHAAAIPCTPVKDTIKQASPQGTVGATLPRGDLRAAQTPQGFHYAALLAAHMAAKGNEYTDDAAIMEAAGVPVAIVEGCEQNQKLTTLADWQRMQPASSMRVGNGFDVHRLIANAQRPLMICGVEVPSDLALEGHSDADVGLHALTDALLGALGEGDIGEHFPPSDDRWRNADSSLFVREAMRLARERGAAVSNADMTIIAESPKLSPFKAAMRARVAELLGVASSQVNVKATTTEGLGFTGRKEGIAAQASVLLMCKNECD